MYLVQFKANYADEFDVYGFSIWDRQHLDEFNEACDKIKRNVARFPMSYYFGTNEEIEFDSPKDVFNSFKITELREFEAQILMNSFSMQINDRKGLFFELADRVSDWELEEDENDD